MLSEDFDSETKNTFNLTKKISSKKVKVCIQNIENIIDAKKAKLKKNCPKKNEAKLSRFIHNNYFLYLYL